MWRPLLLGTGAFVLISWTDALPSNSEDPAVAITPNGTTSNGCALPPQPENGKYKLEDCHTSERSHCQTVTGNTTKGLHLLEYSCYSGYELSGTSIVVCDGVWSAPFPKCSLVSGKCLPLVDPSRFITCQLNKQEVDCDKPMSAGTKAVVTCNTYYTQIAELAKYETTCQSDGTWSRSVQSCVPRCGETKPTSIFSSESIPGYHYWWYLPKKSTETTVGVSWHAGIYLDVTGKNTLVCGGTIISVRVILTGAQCFWDHVSNKQKDEKIFKIAVGKLYNDWYTEERYAQKREIDKIILPQDFRGRIRLGTSDIAVAKLKDPLILNNGVQPICMDFDKKYERLFLPGKNGIVVGWGGNQTEKYSKVLRKVTVPYADFNTCEREVPTSFLPYITADKFCAGYRNGTGVCPGDGGGGYATKFRDGKWYLMGIVSGGVPPEDDSLCDVFTFTIYTRVSDYYDFIISLM